MSHGKNLAQILIILNLKKTTHFSQTWFFQKSIPSSRKGGGNHDTSARMTLYMKLLKTHILMKAFVNSQLNHCPIDLYV